MLGGVVRLGGVGRLLVGVGWVLGWCWMGVMIKWLNS